jgi:hypothetical protein
MLGHELTFIQCPECYVVCGIEWDKTVTFDKWDHMEKIHRLKKIP